MWYNNINTVIPPPHYSPNSLKELRLLDVCVNDPSAGSPTETLLRLLLPLNDKVNSTFQVPTCQTSRQVEDLDPKISPDHSIGRSDGRCVQRAGT